MKHSFAATLMLIALGCSSESPVAPQPVKAGEYLGTIAVTFNASTDSAFVVQNGVTFTFADSGWYTCRGDNILNPPSGAGSFAVQPGAITLTDKVPHLAWFDWTLILNGRFEMRVRVDSLVMTQNDTSHRRYRRIALAIPAG